MHLLVTGCTGFVGSAIARQLVAAGHTVRGVARHPQHPKDPELGKLVELVSGNILEPQTLAPAMEGVDGVVHLVGILLEKREQTFQRVHFEGTHHVVVAAKKAGVQRFLHMSAMGTRPNARSLYHQTKWAAEEYLRASGLDWTIFRPSVIFGPRDNFVTQFARMLRFSPVAPILGDGRAKMQPVWVEDVARCFVKALELPGTIGQTYELGGPRPMSFREIMEAIETASGHQRLPLPIPFPILHLEAAILERLLPTPPITTDQLLMAREDNVGDIHPMCETFGFQPREFTEGLGDYSF